MLWKQNVKAFSSVLRLFLMSGTDLRMSELAFNLIICGFCFFIAEMSDGWLLHTFSKSFTNAGLSNMSSTL